jgi:hypothetical protein
VRADRWTEALANFSVLFFSAVMVSSFERKTSNARKAPKSKAPIRPRHVSRVDPYSQGKRSLLRRPGPLTPFHAIGSVSDW